MPPLILLGALGMGAYLLSRSKPAPASSTVDAIIDASERSSPNATKAKSYITSSLQSANAANYQTTAAYIESQLGMPKTAANLRAFAGMLKGTQGGNISGIGALPERGGPNGPGPLPDWLKFQATTSKLTGDPRYIRATAEALRRYGYRRQAAIHLRGLDE